MAGKKSKVKGNSFELKVSKILSEQLSPLKFIRVPGSGARVGGMNFEKFGGLFSADTIGLFVGDVVASNETEVGMKCKVSIECKSYANVDRFSLLMSGSSKIFEWLKEAEIDAEKTGKVPVLIFKWNRTAIYAASPFLPEDVVKMTLTRDDGLPIKLALLDDVVKVVNWWVSC